MSIKEILDDNRRLLDGIGFNPYYHQIESPLTDPIRIEGDEFINLASNNYLGLANDERIKEAMIEGIKEYGASMCATPIASGYTAKYNSVCSKLANFAGVESAIIFPSCYQANNGLFNTIVKREDVVIVDQYAHSSLIEGIRSVGCKIRPFMHNDILSLERNLIHSKAHNQIFVVTESVFSTEGSIAPLNEMNTLCKKYHAVLVVDDSHGIGVIGKGGKGILSHAGIVDFEGIYTASLGKGFANSGGMIGGKQELIEYLKYYCSHLVYSTVIPPAIIAGIDKTIDIIKDEYDILSSNLVKNTTMLSNGIKKQIAITYSQSPITSVICESTEKTLLFAKYLFENRILATPFVYPSVPKNGGVVRLIASANIKTESVQKAIEIIKRYNQLNNNDLI